MVRGPLPVRDCPRRTVATRVTTNTWPTPNSRKSPVAGKGSGLCPQSFCARVTHFKLVGSLRYDLKPYEIKIHDKTLSSL